MPMPDEKELKKMRKLLDKVEGTLLIAEDASPLEKFRWDICQKFVGFKLDTKISQKELAKILEIDEPKVSKILHHRIDEFSTDRLIELYTRIDPKLKLQID